MNENEQLVFEMIRENPFISQQEIADQIGLSRPAIANMISSLVKKGYILGKAYIVNQSEALVCIGAANVDKKIKTSEKLLPYTSNPVTSTTSLGGVARNVAENLGRLGQNVSLISVVGNDSEWTYIKDLSSPFMDLDYVTVMEGKTTGTYTALLDQEGEMYLGLADMLIYENLTAALLAKQASILQRAKCIAIDLNCPKDAIEYICAFSQKHQIKLVLITVSEPKMDRMPSQLHAVDCLITNIGETSAYFKRNIANKEEIEAAAKDWQALGVTNVILTAGSKEVLLASQNHITWLPVKVLSGDEIVDVTGAGDAFSGAFIDSWLTNEDLPMSYHVTAGMTNSYHTIQSSQTVRQNLTREKLLEEIKEYQK